MGRRRTTVIDAEPGARAVFGQRPPSRASRQTQEGHQSAQGAVAAALRARGVTFTEGVRLLDVWGYPYEVEFLLFPSTGERVPVKVMWQDSPGSAEQKVPWHVIHLRRAAEETSDIERAYLVLGGNGWTRKDAFTGGRLHAAMPGHGMVIVETLEKFLARFAEPVL